MAEDSVLTGLFPDPAVRAAVRRAEVNYGDDPPDYSTNYHLRLANGAEVSSTSGHACFGGLGSQYNEAKGEYSQDIYMHYTPLYHHEVSHKNRVRWVQFGQILGIFPSDRSAVDIVNNGLRINLDDDELGVAELYLTLGFFRWLREAPRVVNKTIDLVDNAGRDFWASVMFSHWDDITRIDHSLLNFKRGDIYSTSTTHRNLALLFRLQKLVTRPLEVDSRIFKEAVVGSSTEGGHFWQWGAKALRVNKTLAVVDRRMLLSSEVYPVIASGSLNAAVKLAARINESSKHVKFAG